MHSARPKSSKGRRRPAGNDSPCSGGADGAQRPPVSPERPGARGSSRNQRSQSQPIMWQAGQLSQDLSLQTLQLAAPPQSFNKYKVLPPIGGRQPGVRDGRSVDQHMSTHSLRGDAVMQQRQRPEEPVMDATQTSSSSEVDMRAGFKPPGSGPMMTKEAGSLLLAIRAPCGRRFQQHFEPTDTLLMVRASAELRYEAEYKEASIQTMDVPRRTFTDMDMSLAQCSILNRSVLCISQN
ncbi:UBX domain-containing protein 10 [Clinocottus analis]|uniref:UBX domain-containing protein 10 n=1 Tax=Clinocottus analis TaxID=304258 RepID=UPI0035BF43AA